MADEPKTDDKAPTAEDNSKNIQLLVGTALGGLSGYLLTRYGLGSKDVPLGLLGTGLGAGVGATIAGQLGVQGKAQESEEERALASAKANLAFKSRLAWLNPMSVPGETTAMHRSRIGYNALAPVAAAAAVYRYPALHQSGPRIYNALRHPGGTIPPPPPLPAGAPTPPPAPKFNGKARYITSGVAALLTLLPSEVLRRLTVNDAERTIANLTPPGK